MTEQACRMCGKPYTPKPSDHGQCVSCSVSLAEEETRMATQARVSAEQRSRFTRRSQRRTGRIFGGAIVLLVIAAVAVLPVLQHSREVAAERRRRNAPSNVYVIETSNFKSRMCRCEDLACADEVQRDFDAWKASKPAPRESEVKAAAADEEWSLTKCHDHLR